LTPFTKRKEKKSTNVGYRSKSKVGLIMDKNNELIIYFAVAVAEEDPTLDEYLMNKERYFFGFDSLSLSHSTFFWLDI
jgi:hypothetical protein